MALPEIRSTYITIARPMGENPGTIEPGHYTVDGDLVTLTDSDGKPLASGRMQIGYSAKLRPEDNADQIAKQLLWRRHRATRAGNDFNRPLFYPPEGWR